MNELLKIIDQKKKELDSYRPVPKELINNLDEWFKIELTYTSNVIEGNTLTRSETALVVEKGITIAGKTLKEHLEAVNLAYALDFVKNLVNKTKNNIDLGSILDIHRIILKGIDDENAGKLRKIFVKISGADVKLPDPIKVPNLIEDFINWLHQTNEHPIKIASDAHLKLVTIHPFVDDNGRTSRLIMNLILMQFGFPPAFIPKEERSNYIKTIEKAQLFYEVDDYYNFIFKRIDKSLDIYLEAFSKTIN